jgi:hypothetical protein
MQLRMSSNDNDVVPNHPVTMNKAGYLAAALLPVLAVLVGSPAEVSSLCLGLVCAWMAETIVRANGLPASRSAWLEKMRTVWGTVGMVTALFIVLGLTVGVQTNMPFPIMALVSAFPAAGIVPWLTLRVPNRYGPIILGAMIVFLAKLTGCIAARIVYGPFFIEKGYVAGDWNKAPLMISVTWGLSTLISLGMIWADSRRLGRNERFPESFGDGSFENGGAGPQPIDL